MTGQQLGGLVSIIWGIWWLVWAAAAENLHFQRNEPKADTLSRYFMFMSFICMVVGTALLLGK